ncbi:MAG: hypothetical protein JXA81_12105 [Sedimentisphaerales bacterium]|nr:hypothetical protein [Sedimentisphaerales bacterium]
MYKFNLLSVIAALLILSGGNAYAEDWKVGEKWIYKHEGPRPYADPSAMVKDDRTVEVTAIKGEGAEKRYLLKNMWGSEDSNPSTSYIDSKNMLHKIDIEYMFTLLITPPIPVFWLLKPGEEKTLRTNMEFAGFSIPIEYIAKRMKDETITVPAGKFENCQHVQIISSLQNENGQIIKNKEEYWYHPHVRNLVKGVIITNYHGDNSYTSTNLLKSHLKKD